MSNHVDPKLREAVERLDRARDRVRKTATTTPSQRKESPAPAMAHEEPAHIRKHKELRAFLEQTRNDGVITDAQLQGIMAAGKIDKEDPTPADYIIATRKMVEAARELGDPRLRDAAKFARATALQPAR